MKTKIDSAQKEELRENLLSTLDMFDSGCSLLIERFRRENPDLSEEALENKLIEWLSGRPLDAPVANGEPS